MRGSPGGGFRRGKTDVQTPRTLALEDRLWKNSEGPRIENLARRPEMGGGPLRAFRRGILISAGFYERLYMIERQKILSQSVSGLCALGSGLSALRSGI